MQRILTGTLVLSAAYAVYLVTVPSLLCGRSDQRAAWWEWPGSAHDLLFALGVQPFYARAYDVCHAGRFGIAVIGFVASLPASLVYVLLIVWAARRLRCFGRQSN